MTFKRDWEKVSSLHTLNDSEILGMIGVVYKENELLNYEVLAAGCSNINIRVDFKKNLKSVLLRVYIRDKDACYKEENILKEILDNVPIYKMYGIYKYRNYTFAILEFIEGITLADYLLEGGREESHIEKIMYQIGQALSAISKIKSNKIEKAPQESYLSYGKGILREEELKKHVCIFKIEKVLDSFSKYFPTEGEKNLVHGDFNPANILIKQVEGEYQVSAIIDWEYAFFGSTLSDIADMLRYAKSMPKVYQRAFLKGLKRGGFKLPLNLQKRIDIINLVTILDCMRRGLTKPILIEDCKALVEEIVSRLLKEIEIKKL
jgi:aminoglycoside phosphotransferase (APT) family kinase protein